MSCCCSFVKLAAKNISLLNHFCFSCRITCLFPMLIGWLKMTDLMKPRKVRLIALTVRPGSYFASFQLHFFKKIMHISKQSLKV